MSTLEYAWITVNRQCNLRCKWCYAKSTEFSPKQNMTLKLAKELIDFCKQLNINEIALIGGEPTCFDGLEELISYISNNNMESWLITNGLKFNNISYLKKLIDAGLTGINFSLKGWSKESYIANTGVDVFEKTLSALQNVSSKNIKCKVSFVLNDENISHLIEVVNLAKKQGANDFYFSFEHDFSILDGNFQDSYDLSKVSKLINGFSSIYKILNKITNGNFTLHQSFPICMWDDNIISQLTANKQIYTSCSLLRRCGLTFDTDGSLIPCNAMYKVPIGKYRVDFNNPETFISFWDSKEITSIYNTFRRFPSLKCSNCSKSLTCGGGCISNWYHYSYDDLIKANLIKDEI